MSPRSFLSRRQPTILAVALPVAIYVISYIVNSAYGGYWPIPERSEYDDGFASAVQWQPRFGHFSLESRLNDRLGYFFLPLIRLDRMFVHRTMGRGFPGSYDRSLQLRANDIHPTKREWFVKHMQPNVEDAVRRGRIAGDLYE